MLAYRGMKFPMQVKSGTKQAELVLHTHLKTIEGLRCSARAHQGAAWRADVCCQGRTASGGAFRAQVSAESYSCT
eukprot:4133810-Amphidinium_carterae.1